MKILGLKEKDESEPMEAVIDLCPALGVITLSSDVESIVRLGNFEVFATRTLSV